MAGYRNRNPGSPRLAIEAVEINDGADNRNVGKAPQKTANTSRPSLLRQPSASLKSNGLRFITLHLKLSPLVVFQPKELFYLAQGNFVQIMESTTSHMISPTRQQEMLKLSTQQVKRLSLLGKEKIVKI